MSYGLAAVLQVGLEPQDSRNPLCPPDPEWALCHRQLPGLESLMETAQRKDLPWQGLNILRRAIHPSYDRYTIAETPPPPVQSLVPKAERLRLQANKELTKRTTYSNAHAEAIDLYKEAAKRYSLEGMHKEAGECYKSASDSAFSVHQPELGTDLLCASAEEYLKIEQGGGLDIGVWIFDQAIELYSNMGRAIHVGRIHRRIADVLAAHDILDHVTIDRYRTAATFFKDRTLRDACNFQVATLLCNRKEYLDAIPVFEEMARHKYPKIGMFFHAMLAALASIVPGNRLPGLERCVEMFDRYQDDEVKFQVGQEHMVTKTLIQAWKKQSVELADEALAKGLNILERTPLTDAMLTHVHANVVKHVDLIDEATFSTRYICYMPAGINQKEEEAAAKQKAKEEAAAEQRAKEEAIAKKKAEEEAAAKKRADEEAADWKRQQKDLEKKKAEGAVWSIEKAVDQAAAKKTADLEPKKPEVANTKVVEAAEKAEAEAKRQLQLVKPIVAKGISSAMATFVK